MTNSPTVAVQTVSTEWVNTPLMVAYTNSPLAITQVPDNPNTFTITFLPSGQSLPVIHRDWQELTGLLDTLAGLPWPETAEEIKGIPGMKLEIMNAISEWMGDECKL